MSMDIDPVVDVSFPLSGTTIPADHGYLLYAAISGRAPVLHENARAGVHPIGGRPSGGRRLALTPASRLTLRLPAALIPEALDLAGTELAIDGGMLPRQPCPRFHAALDRIVPYA
ncbi:MAG: type I-MYXAN CRISPR-associated protein Cas6/Cmx6, partial [Chloroflexi bacterium]|nr:type I-MYXAN CRISPR-associated protein Cas6/Cmx6 [Chloroflexota bacterium]